MVRCEVGEGGRSRGGGNAGGVVEVLEGYGDAVQGPAIAPRSDLLLGLMGGGQGSLRLDGDEGVQEWVQGVDALEGGAGDLNRR